LKNRQRNCYALRSSLFSCNKQQKTIPTYLDVIFFFYYTYIGRQKALDIVVFYWWLLVLGTNLKSKVSQLLLLARCVNKNKKSVDRKASVKICINAVASHE